MSLYNLIFGYSPWFYLVLPMLGKYRSEYPRFRDCFLGDEERPEYELYIHVYTRSGGGNRDKYPEENDAMRSMPEYVTDYDESFDSTYATWVFRVPARWQGDFEAIISGQIATVSPEYRAEVRRIHPDLTDDMWSKLNDSACAPRRKPSSAALQEQIERARQSRQSRNI